MSTPGLVTALGHHGQAWRDRGKEPASHAGRAAPRQGTVATETLQRCLQGTQALFSLLPPASPARLKEKTGNTGLHDCRPCSRPRVREWAGLGDTGRGPPAQSCSHRPRLRELHKLPPASGHTTLLLRGPPGSKAQCGENAAQRPTSCALPTLDPAGGILGAPRSAEGGQVAPENQAPRTVLRAGHLNPAPE